LAATACNASHATRNPPAPCEPDCEVEPDCDETGCACPASVPAHGTSCPQAAQICRYGDPCEDFEEHEASCGADGLWSVQSYGTSCNPPPPWECPYEIPAPTDFCDSDFAEGPCTYPDPQCPDGEVVATCFDYGWQLEYTVDCNPPPPCPADLPDAGEACDPSIEGQLCTYVHPDCPEESYTATCTMGAWAVDAPVCI
jgi:hypothetical protein